MPCITIGVTGLNAVDNPGPGVGIARSLREDPELEVRIVGLAYNALEPGLYLDWVVDESFTLPYPSSGADEYLDRLRYIQQTVGLDCVIPCLDAELPLFIRNMETLDRWGVRTFLPTMAQFRLRGKDRLPQLAAQSGLKTPRTFVVNDEGELWRAMDELGLPAYVKGIYYDARRATTAADVAAQYRRILGEWGGPVLLQEIVSGEELNVVGVGDGAGGHLGLVGARKTVVTALGKMWSGVTIRHPAMLAAAESFTAAHRWRGPFELECIVRGDDVYLIEINPRFPAWVYFATAVGVNLPARMVRSLYELPAETHSCYESGRLFLRYSYDMLAATDQYHRLLTTGQM
jgi:carbamoyl-phosphate synthase large subunit